MRSILTSIAIFTGIVLPTVGLSQAYLSPEQVLQQEESSFLRPGRQRGAQWAADLQVQQNIERHPVMVTYPWDPEPVANELPPPTQVPVGQAMPMDEAFGYGNDTVSNRLLERIAQEQMLLRTGFLASTAGYGRAPLAGTGPGAVIAAITMIGATVWTLRRARTLEKFVRGA